MTPFTMQTSMQALKITGVLGLCCFFSEELDNKAQTKDSHISLI